jgi:benzoate/toluate 1,2-dioxygenase alpha subunit
LGETTKIIDMIVDQSEQGLKFYVVHLLIPMKATGNSLLKMVQMVITFLLCTGTMQQQLNTVKKQAADNIRAMSAGSWGKQGGGSYGFENGHMLLWTQWANPEDRPNFQKQMNTPKNLVKRCRNG